MHHIDLNFTNNQYKTESIIRSLNSSSFKSDRVKKSKKKDDPSRHLPSNILQFNFSFLKHFLKYYNFNSRERFFSSSITFRFSFEKRFKTY